MYKGEALLLERLTTRFPLERSSAGRLGALQWEQQWPSENANKQDDILF